MGYGNPDLEEITDEKLIGEIDRRARARQSGLCPYCHRDVVSPPCLYAAQHKHARHIVTMKKIAEATGAVATILET